MKQFDFRRVLPCFLLTFIVLAPAVLASGDSGLDSFLCPGCGKVPNITIDAPATCVSSGSFIYSCPSCGRHARRFYGPVASSHAWEETGRIDATASAPGGIVYTCSLCGETKTENIPQFPPVPDLPTLDECLTLPELLSAMGGIFSTISDWIAAVTASLISHPILLMLVVLGFVGTGAGLFRRLLNL